MRVMIKILDQLQCWRLQGHGVHNDEPPID